MSIKYFFTVFLFQLLVITSFPAETDDQFELTKYITDNIRVFSEKELGNSVPAVIFPVKSNDRFGYSGDSLFVPLKYWGFSTTNSFGLHFYTCIHTFFEAYSKIDTLKNSESFFLNSGRASNAALRYINTLDKGPLLNSLLIKEYVYIPLEKYAKSVSISDGFRSTDAGKYYSMLKSILYYRADSLNIKEWLNSDKETDYSIIEVKQKPTGWKKFDIDITLRNEGATRIPFELMVDLATGPKNIKINGFNGDTTILLTEKSSCLKVIIDPFMQIPDFNRKNQQFVSTEFSNRRRAYQAFAILIWNSLSAISAFLIILLSGIMIHSLTQLFYSNNTRWTALFVLLFMILKIAMPLLLVGFNMWGFVYLINVMAAKTNPLWMAVSLGSVSMLVYWVFTKDDVNMGKLSTFLKYLLVVIFAEPIVFSLGL